MKELVSLPIFGIVVSIAAYEIGILLYRKFKVSIFNPLLVSIILLIVFLQMFNIDLESYNKGGNLISFFLSPATVILAVPLYKQIEHLKANIIPIVGGIIIGCLSSIGSILFFSEILGLDYIVELSLIPKSITTPIGIELSKQLGAIPSITVSAIIITGLTGAVLGPFICRIFGIKDEIAVGIAIGTSSHALGTATAIKLGETEGAMSSLAIGIAGLVTVFITTFLIRL